MTTSQPRLFLGQKIPCFPVSWILTLLTLLGAAAENSTCQAGDLYVDNEIGSDKFNGLSPQPTELRYGPVRTISRALQLAQAADIIHVAPGSQPYYETLSLRGSRHSGTSTHPFEIRATGAVLSGARRVPPSAWVEVDTEIWRYTPDRKGFAQLFRGPRRLPEVLVAPASVDLPELSPSSWCFWKGSIYYRQVPGYNQSPVDQPLEFAHAQCGLTLLDVDYVTITGLRIERFRMDAANAHDRARNVLFENVTFRDNGRAGLAVGGTSLVGVRRGEFSGNRLVQVLTAEKSWTEVVESRISAEPGEPYEILGGRLFVDGDEIPHPDAATP